MKPKAAVLLLHYQNNPDTKECLDSLLEAQKKAQFEVYILAVQSNQSEQLARHPIHPTIEVSDHNGGFAWGYNRLMQSALKNRNTDLVLLNNDTTVAVDAIPKLQISLHQPNVGLVSPKIYFYPGKEFHQHSYRPDEQGQVIWYAGGILDWANVHASHWGVDEVDHGQFDQAKETDFATGCCVAVTSQTVDRVGFMDESYFLYWEDVDWSMRVKRAGLKVVYAPQAVVWHKNAGSTGGAGSTTQVNYQNRSRLKFGLRYAPLRTKFHLLKDLA